MSLLGLKDLSVIGTPPSNRLAIRTYVQRYEQVSFLTAVNNEISRNGQIFIVVPRISHIPFVESEIKKLNIELSFIPNPMFLTKQELKEKFFAKNKKPFMGNFYKLQRSVSYTHLTLPTKA